MADPFQFKRDRLTVAGDHDYTTSRSVGRKFIVEPSGTRLTNNERSLLRELQPAGVMLRTRNFLQDAPYPVWVKELEQLLTDIRTAIDRPQVIVCIDHEGGRVIRPPLPITRFPYAAAYSTASAAVGRAMAVELKSLGVNVSFSPVADIHSNPENPVINQRAFGQTPQRVANCAAEFYRALHSEGIMGCAKHFPGHGDTTVDSHVDLPVLSLTAEHINARELVPFKHLIDNGIPLVMSGHLMIPDLDPEWPATLSPIILNELLRQRLGFSGVTVSDGLGMDAIRSYLDTSDGVVQGVKAGLDLFLVAGDGVSIEDAQRWARMMCETIDSGAIPKETITTSLARIDAMLAALPQISPYCLDTDVLRNHRELAEGLQTSNSTDFCPELPGFG